MHKDEVHVYEEKRRVIDTRRVQRPVNKETNKTNNETKKQTKTKNKRLLFCLSLHACKLNIVWVSI